jgi:hypothetical protein
MHIGFTGTSGTVRESQISELKWVLEKLAKLDDTMTLHHGDCINADAIADRIAFVLGYHIVIHPPDNNSKRAFCDTRGMEGREMRYPKPYLERNHDIVNNSTFLVAVPSSAYEYQRSGTWSTVRYARKVHVPIIFILPSEEK